MGLELKIFIFKICKYVAHMDCEESWVLKNWCFWTVVLEKTLEGPLDYKEIQSVHSKGDQSWVFIGRTDAEAETPILWPPHAKSWLIGKDPDVGRDWGQEEKWTTGWDGWMASPTRWTWVWVNSGSWWWTGRPDVLRFMGSQKVGHDWTTEQNWTEHVWRVKVSVTPWTVAHQAPPSMGFSRQECWSGLPFPSPGESSQPRDRTWVSRIAGRCFNLWATSEEALRVVL